MATHSALITGVAASSVSHLLAAALCTVAISVNPNGLIMAKTVNPNRFADIDLQPQKTQQKSKFRQ
ncbi:hypothetical protein FGW20_07410 [Methanoculleus sp. FWC-SCC3]|jgi:hypothetical protein|uniref:Uncharacterized protein n=1 Tax=Methanoculleus methanifontis TaxID=2584086 RepID=A0ABT8M1E8_9EURY|nr:hypothetical protein [Methanoculleus sp. FWC-SCC3]MDN7012870.1 hypothetical protein [Methanoculleus sp. FWC-SCC3]